MTSDEEIEENKIRAAEGWIGEPPAPGERTPLSHLGKWRKMMNGKQTAKP